MSETLQPTRTSTMRWVGVALGTALLFGVAFFGVLQVERERLDAAARISRQHGRADDDLTTGFLHFTLGARQGGAWERPRGYVLLQQALRELETSVRGLPDTDQLTAGFRKDLADFERLLKAQSLRSGTLQDEVALQLALGRLKTTAEAVDVRLRARQQQFNDRFDRNFDIAIALGLLLISVFGLLAIRSALLQRRLFEKLVDSESKFRGLVEQSIAGVAIIQDGVVTYANPRAAEIVGATVEGLLGRNFLDFVVERDREASRQILVQLASDPKGQYAGAFFVNRSDGAEVRLELQASPVRINGTPAVLGIVQDVSERYRMESERLEALQMLETVSRSSGEAIFVKDLNGRYTFFNAQAEWLSGKPASEVIGRDDHILFPPEEAEKVMALDRQILRDLKVYHVETLLPTPTGPRCMDVVKGPLFDRKGGVSGIFGVTRDMTDRKAQELALEESRAELEAVIDALEEGVVVYAPDGHVLRVNPAARRITGFNIAQASGMSVAERKIAVAWEDLDGTPIPFADSPAQRTLRGETVNNMECVLLNTGKGIRRILNCNGSLVKNPDGGVLLGLVTFTDVTERRQAEKAIIQAQRLESLGTLAAGIAHDFNNILLAITGNAILADADLPPEHPAHASLQEVLRAGQRAKDLVRRILLFARAEDARRQTADLRDVVSEAVELIRPTLPARIQIKTSSISTLLPVSMDTSQLHQVVVNVLTNAAHAIEDSGSERRGQVEVSLAEVELPQTVHAGSRILPPGNYASLVVADDGCGMDAAVLARVFDPFFTTKVVGRGTGLGLSIVRGIVEDHGGAINIQSAPGKGTRIEILLPKSVEQPQLEKPIPGVVRGAGRHVLYIDDEAALVSLVTRYLQRHGYEVTGNTDPEEALAVFNEAPERYDLVVTDLSMPQMSGFDVARIVRDRAPNIPVIMMSGYVRPEDRERALALGVRDVLLKPSTVEDLCRTIDSQLH